MKPHNILAFPTGTEIGLEIYNALKYSKYVNLFEANSIPAYDSAHLTLVENREKLHCPIVSPATKWFGSAGTRIHSYTII